MLFNTAFHLRSSSLPADLNAHICTVTLVNVHYSGVIFIVHGKVCQWSLQHRSVYFTAIVVQVRLCHSGLPFFL